VQSVQDIWSVVLKILQHELSEVAVELWFGGCNAVGIDNDTFTIVADTAFKRDLINEKYYEKLSDALKQVFGQTVKPLVLAEGDDRKVIKNLDSRFSKDKYNFDNFIVGPSNRLAHAAACAVAEETNPSYNPLFIYGNPGLGKTHLLYAIAHRFKENHPDAKIIYVKAEGFVNELIEAIRGHTNIDFKAKYRTADLLLVDDIQFIIGKDSSQEEFFHTFNNLYETGSQIVLTSDRPPKDMLRLEDRLKSRFEWGLLADIRPPDLETRMAVVKSKCAEFGVSIPPSITKYIAENITSNIRMIEGVIKKISAYKDLLKTSDDINISEIQTITNDIIQKEKQCTPESIVNCVGKHFSISPESIKGRSREKNIIRARQISMYIIRNLTDLTMDEIGKTFGNKDHTTVLHAIRKIEEGLESNPQLADEIRDISTDVVESDDL